MELGKTINELRKKNNMTQEELAAKLGVSAQAVSKWENDLSCPDISLLPDISKLFGISVDELLGGDYQGKDTGHDNPDFAELPGHKDSDNHFKDIKKINIAVDNHGKMTNVSLPIKLVRFGMNIGSAFGGLTDGQSQIIMDAIQNGLSGEILKVNGEHGEIVTISLE